MHRLHTLINDGEECEDWKILAKVIDFYGPGVMAWSAQLRKPYALPNAGAELNIQEQFFPSPMGQMAGGDLIRYWCTGG